MKRNHIWAIALGVVAVLGSSCQKATVDVDNGFDVARDSTHTPVEPSGNGTNTSKYAQARIFPGLVCSDEPRITTTVSMNLKYFDVDQVLRVSVPPAPQFSTGLYAAPGELVEVTVPDNMYSLSLQIGAWTDNLTALSATGPINRDPVIVSRVQLAPGKNQVRNLYGGHIYIVPNVAMDQPVNISFANVVKSPDYIMGQTSVADWQAAIKKSCVPWLELRGKYTIFTVPREYCLMSPVQDPEGLLREWDEVMKQDFYGWQGLSENPADPIDQSPVLPARIVLDNNPVVGYGHNGFPVVAFMDMNWFVFSADLRNLMESKTWGTHHELGHNNQQGWWSWSSLGEVTNNLFIYKTAKRHSFTNPSAWPALHDINAAAGRFDNLASTFAKALSFSASTTANKDFDKASDPILGDDPFARLTPFLQLFEKIPANYNGNGRADGWGFFPYLYSQTRRAVRTPAGDLGKHDYFYEMLSDYVKADFQLFFKAWGIQISDLTRNRVAAKYDPFPYDIWNYNPATKTGGDKDVFFIPSAWSVISFSSDHSEGRVGNLIDDNLTTYWHTQYGPTIPPPHFAVIDLKKALTFSKVAMAHRPNGSGTSRPIKNIYVDYSTDNVNWTPAPLSNSSADGNYIVTQNIQGLQTFNLDAPVTARYVRVRVPSRNDMFAPDDLACLAEFRVVK
ncbi:M60 family metallopeptidase [Niabella hirudinis]|uniref:M60 family metallopeptidase n=1 Tax=Niabella hirudinis TaxID=1285929 RepID=UPI003EC151E0